MWKYYPFSFSAPPTQCAENEFKCDDNVCLSKEKVCDRVRDCRDGTDELDCREYSHLKDFFSNKLTFSKYLKKNAPNSRNLTHKNYSIFHTLYHRFFFFFKCILQLKILKKQTNTITVNALNTFTLSNLLA